MTLARLTSAMAALVGISLPQVARGQDAASASSLSISAVGTNARHELLGDPLLGVSARLGIPLRGRAFTAHLSADHQTGSAPRMENFCFSFGQPNEPGCVDEPVNDDARLFALSGGVGIALLNRARLAIDLVGDLGLAWIRVDTRATTSTGHVPTSNQLWSGMAGVEASWSPWKQLPVALQAGVAAGFLKPIFAEQTVDGYRPFEYELGFTRLRLGVAWQPMGR